MGLDRWTRFETPFLTGLAPFKPRSTYNLDSATVEQQQSRKTKWFFARKMAIATKGGSLPKKNGIFLKRLLIKQA